MRDIKALCAMAAVALILMSPIGSASAQSWGGPDYGYRHRDYDRDRVTTETGITTETATPGTENGDAGTEIVNMGSMNASTCAAIQMLPERLALAECSPAGSTIRDRSARG